MVARRAVGMPKAESGRSATTAADGKPASWLVEAGAGAANAWWAAWLGWLDALPGADGFYRISLGR
jgi:hypothetical protein